MKDKALRKALGYRAALDEFEEAEINEIKKLDRKINLLAKELGYRFERDWDMDRVEIVGSSKK